MLDVTSLDVHDASITTFGRIIGTAEMRFLPLSLSQQFTKLKNPKNPKNPSWGILEKNTLEIQKDFCRDH